MGGLLDFMKGANDAAASTLYGPIDLLSLALRKAGLPMPDDQNVPGSKAWLQGKGLLHEAPVNAASAAGQTLGLLSPIVAQAKAPQISAGLLRMIDNANAPGAMNAATRNQAGAIVYHGSPHKFDKFDSTKIGTGEGAQAYGHGLYVAESRDVATKYANDLAASRQSLANRGLAGASGDVDVAIAATQAEISRLKALPNGGGDPQRMARFVALNEEKLAELAKLKAGQQMSQPSLYKIDLPDEHIAKMLDWDKPLSQQAPEVRKFFEPKVAPIRAEMAKPADPGWGDLAAPTKYDPSGQELLGLLRNRDADQTVQSFLGNGLGRDVSEALRAQGIPGIRYLDGGSRTAGAGSSNFVVFPGNEGLLSILERNGVPINGK